MDIGNKVKDARNILNVSVEEFAKRLGVSMEEVEIIENGGAVVTVEQLSRISKALHVSSDYLLGLESDSSLRTTYELALIRCITSNLHKLNCAGISRAVEILKELSDITLYVR